MGKKQAKEKVMKKEQKAGNHIENCSFTGVNFDPRSAAAFETAAQALKANAEAVKENYEQKPEYEARTELINRTCLRCKREFLAHDRYTRLCSEHCRRSDTGLRMEGGSGRMRESYRS